MTPAPWCKVGPESEVDDAPRGACLPGGWATLIRVPRTRKDQEAQRVPVGEAQRDRAVCIDGMGKGPRRCQEEGQKLALINSKTKHGCRRGWLNRSFQRQ